MALWFAKEGVWSPTYCHLARKFCVGKDYEFKKGNSLLSGELRACKYLPFAIETSSRTSAHAARECRGSLLNMICRYADHLLAVPTLKNTALYRRKRVRDHAAMTETALDLSQIRTSRVGVWNRSGRRAYYHERLSGIRQTMLAARYRASTAWWRKRRRWACRDLPISRTGFDFNIGAPPSFRAPHRRLAVALVGAAIRLVPRISLAHRGVLFLDEYRI